jgi:YggT family protein
MGALVQATIGGLALVLWLLIFARLLLSWVDPMGRTSAAGFLISMTEWLLAPIRRMLPQAGMFDFSGLLVLLVLGAVMRALL